MKKLGSDANVQRSGLYLFFVRVRVNGDCLREVRVLEMFVDGGVGKNHLVIVKSSRSRTRRAFDSGTTLCLSL
jgi:hypothetical protein